MKLGEIERHVPAGDEILVKVYGNTRFVRKLFGHIKKF